jgi:tRNA(fMet)-specific endonuclease VapC
LSHELPAGHRYLLGLHQGQPSGLAEDDAVQRTPTRSAITAAELFAWALRAKASPARQQAVLDFFNDVTFLEVDRDVSRKFGEIRAAQLDQGQYTPEMDLLIASTALAHGLTLVTHNTQDFTNVPGLTLEDWLVP